MRQSAGRVLTESSDLQSSQASPPAEAILIAVPAKAEASATGLELSVNSYTAVTSWGASGLTTLHKYAVFMFLLVDTLGIMDVYYER
jgi:hypothetical protein